MVYCKQPLQAQQEGFGHLTVIKRVSDLTNRDFQPSDFDLRLIIDNGTTIEFDGSRNGQVFSIKEGLDYEVREVRTSVMANLDISTTSSPECSGSLIDQEEVICTLRNQVNGVFETESARIPESDENLTRQKEVQQGIGQTEAANETQQAEEFESESGLIIQPPSTTSPFKRCLAPAATGTPLDANGDPIVNPATTTVIPSSAKYTIEGQTSISELISSLDLNNFMTIKIFNDQKSNDGITFGTANPRFIGSIDVGTNDIVPVDSFRYFVNNIDSTCDFVTAIKPISQQPDRAFAPTGERN